MPSETQRQYRPEGYKIADLGPVALEGKGVEEMQPAKDKIRKLQRCPFYIGEEL